MTLGGGGVDNTLDSLRNLGGNIYQCVADFRAFSPLWKRIVTGFCQSDLKNSLLIVWCGVETTDGDIVNVNKVLSSFDTEEITNRVVLLKPKDGKNFSPHILKKSTHFITTREPVSLECLDWIYGNVKIISALDDGIFDGEPEINWEEFVRKSPN